LSTNYNVSSWITYLAILYIKQSKLLDPGLCRATEQLLSVILNVSKYLTQTHSNIPLEHHALFITDTLHDPLYRNAELHGTFIKDFYINDKTETGN